MTRADSIALICCLIAVHLGCASVRPILRDGPVALAPDEGILLVHVDTNTSIDDLGFTGAWAVSDLKPGVHLRAVVAVAGEYRWNKVHWRGRTSRMRGDRKKEWNFRVEPGRVNYVGQLILRERRQGVWQFWLELEHHQRSGLLLKELRLKYPTLLETFPLAYTGKGRDEFLERYSRAVRELGEPAP